jgi:hypothetical protein
LCGRFLWQSLKNRPRKIFFTRANLFRGIPAGGSQRRPLSPSVPRIGDPHHQTTLFEAGQVPGQRAGGDAEASSELAEPEISVGKCLEGCRLGNGHPAAGDIGPLGKRKAVNQGANTLSEAPGLVVGL